MGKSGILDANEAQREGWVIPKDRQAAEKRKDELRKNMEERKKKKKKEEEKNQNSTAKRPV